ncbi:MAG TPA: hypothetical protein VEM38_08880 [Burkholderiales bacterium]|nr:hypothetical protein [Burkholderiales bacterium]
MKNRLIALTSMLWGMIIVVPSVMAGDLVEFEHGVGAVSFGPFTVRDVNPDIQTWVIGKFRAHIKTNGDIKAEGEGLVQITGLNFGTALRPVPAPLTTTTINVFATLFCGSPIPAAPVPTAHHSGDHPLSASGNFHIVDVLTPTPPDPCADPVLLIRIAEPNPADPRHWVAGGIIPEN